MDEPSGRISLVRCLETLSDPRVERARRHKLVDILVIAICAVIADADGWEDIEVFAQVRRQWFASFLELPGGIPSHDTFARVFARLDPRAFQRCFLDWVKAVAAVTGRSNIALDGKTLRRSFDRAKGVSPLHLVSAWATESQLTLGQVAVEPGTNEITAAHALLDLLEIKGCLVTIDAIGCQREIAAKIVTKGGDYVLALKGNQPSLHGDVSMAFDGADADRLTARLGAPVVTTDGRHGRIEERRYWLTGDLDWLTQRDVWSGLKGIGIAERSCHGDGTVTTERRYFLLSFADDTARFAAAVRGHWGIETSLHWRLDVTFREDQSRIRRGHGPENFALLRKAAICLLSRAPGKKTSIAKKRFRAALDHAYLWDVLHSATECQQDAGPASAAP